ncbi:PREDICTED: aldehyde oxidase GLOX-like, partial [Camelina sativa]
PDDGGNLFVFANSRAVKYDHRINAVVKEYPPLDGGPRNYPSGGSSAMLAIQGDFATAEILICGGAQSGAFTARATDAPAHGTCGRIVATAADPVWVTEEMPFG